MKLKDQLYFAFLAIFIFSCGSAVSDTVDISAPGSDNQGTVTSPGSTPNNPDTIPSRPETPPPSKEQLLAEAINEGQFIVFLDLINSDSTLLTASLNDENQSTALILTVRASRYKMIKVLLEKGANRETTDKNGLNALDYADLGPSPAVMKEFLISKGEPDQEFLNAGFHSATKDLSELDLFLNLGADIDSALIEEGGREAKTVMRKAIDLSDLDLVVFLVERDASLTFLARGRPITALDYARRTNSAGTKEAIIEYLSSLGS